MTIEDFICYINRGEIPPFSPINYFNSSSNNKDLFLYRSVVTKASMWAIVDMTWTKQLAEKIGDRTVLEVMSGRGWLCKALKEHGVDIVGTDMHVSDPVCEIEELDAIAAINRYKNRSDVLLMSWPPYAKTICEEVINEWGDEKEMIVIGENSGGCTGTDRFWDELYDHKIMDVSIPRWPAIHDHVHIGRRFSKQYHQSI